MTDHDDKPDNLIPIDFTAKREPENTHIRPVQRHRLGSFQRIVSGSTVLSCGHYSLEIDEETLDIECVDCHEEIDARLLVLWWARRERQLEWSHKAAEDLRRERAELERQVRNLKAQLRRARKGAR